MAFCGIQLGACVDDDYGEDELSLELHDLSSVGFSWTGGEAGASVRWSSVSYLPRRGEFGGTPCISSNNEGLNSWLHNVGGVRL